MLAPRQVELRDDTLVNKRRIVRQTVIERTAADDGFLAQRLRRLETRKKK
ncbi:hypothetical protein P3T33_005257 [Rhizobium sp. AN67]|nr:hypothetical protein [Rhizobium sp. AN67]